MAVQLFTNQASTLLDATLSIGATSLTVSAGDGALFPNPSSGDWFNVTIQNGTLYEIVKCTGRAGDVLTIVRAQDGTADQAWAIGDTAELRVHAEWLGKVHTTDSLPTASIGDVLGPGSSTDDNIATFDLTTGKLIQDGGSTIAQVVAAGAAAAPQGDVVGPGSATSGNVASFSGTTGKLIADGAKLAADLVTGPASAVDSEIALFNGTTGKILKSAGVLLSSKAGVANGTWTPDVTFGGGSTGLAYTTRAGRYTRIDDLVFLTVFIQMSNKGSSTGNAAVSLPPFTAHADTMSGGVGVEGAFNMLTLTSKPSSLVLAGATTLALLHWGATGHSALTDANFSNTTYLYLNGFYRASTSV